MAFEKLSAGGKTQKARSQDVSRKCPVPSFESWSKLLTVGLYTRVTSDPCQRATRLRMGGPKGSLLVGKDPKELGSYKQGHPQRRTPNW